MKNVFILSAVLCCVAGSAFASAQDWAAIMDARLNGYDVVAPVMKDSTIPPQQAGLIFFDASSGTYKGFDTSGTALTMSSSATAGTVVTGGSGGMRMETTSIGGATEFSNCDSTSCNIYNNTSGITGVNRTAAGHFSISLTSTGCSSHWSCHATGYDYTNSRPVWCGGDAAAGNPSTTNYYFQCRESGTAQTDTHLDISCSCPL